MQWNLYVAKSARRDESDVAGERRDTAAQHISGAVGFGRQETRPPSEIRLDAEHIANHSRGDPEAQFRGINVGHQVAREKGGALADIDAD